MTTKQEEEVKNLIYALNALRAEWTGTRFIIIDRREPRKEEIALTIKLNSLSEVYSLAMVLERDSVLNVTMSGDVINLE